MVLDSKHIVKCVKCDNLAHKIMVVQDRGYGSELDCLDGNTFIPVCPECAKELKDEWFFEQCTLEDGYCETYPNEHHIMGFINSLPDGMRNEVLQ